MIARRDECARAVQQANRMPARFTSIMAGLFVGTGFSILVAAAWTVHAVAAWMP